MPFGRLLNNNIYMYLFVHFRWLVPCIHFVFPTDMKLVIEMLDQKAFIKKILVLCTHNCKDQDLVAQNFG